MRTSMQFVALAFVVAVSTANSVADVIYVNAAAPDGGDGTSWATAFNDLQDGLVAATPDSGDELWVVAGIYKPTGPGGDRAISFNLVSGTAIYGGFNGTETKLERRDPALNITILSGDLDGNDVGDALDPTHSENSDHVVRATSTTAGTVLDGLTVTAGNSNGSGGGVLTTSSLIDIVNCTITANACSGSGCGVRISGGSVAVIDSRINHNNAIGTADGTGVYAFQTNLTMTNCEVNHNIASTTTLFSQGGAMVLWESSVNVESCLFDGNQSYQCGGIQVVESPGSIANCTFSNNRQNSGGALLLFDPILVIDCQFIANESIVGAGGGLGLASFASGPQIVNCFFAGNTAPLGGGFRQQQGPATFVNCVFTGNSAATSGGALYLSGASSDSISLLNCTIAGNLASQAGGGVFRNGNVPLTSLNTILWGNTDSEGSGETAQLRNGLGGGSIKFSTVQGWTGALGDGTNNGVDPLFVDADGPDNTIGTEDDNLRLAAASLGIDNGDPATPPAYPTDIDGQPREIACIVDRGAYESADSNPVEPDCNNNGVQDSCDIDAQYSTDCNFNRVPDDCDIASQTSADLDANGIPDECQGVPLNNLCGVAKVAISGNNAFTNVNATTEGPSEPAGCGFADGQLHNDVWFRYPAQCAGIVTISLCGANFDARLAVYVGCPSEPGQMIACSDNVCGDAPRVSFNNATTTIYRVRIGGSSAGTAGMGGGNMVITCTPAPQCPGDANGDGNVNITDLLLVITNWGQSGLNPADVNGDSVVNVADLLGVIAGWGPC